MSRPPFLRAKSWVSRWDGFFCGDKSGRKKRFSFYPRNALKSLILDEKIQEIQPHNREFRSRNGDLPSKNQNRIDQTGQAAGDAL